MGDEIEMKLMFVNYDAPISDEVLKGVKITQPVSDLKKRVMAERWPEDHTPLEKVRVAEQALLSLLGHSGIFRMESLLFFGLPSNL